MRLQISIHRNTLPPVHLLYNTRRQDASHPSITTIADLLSALDALVPLESADGEWGLEDYVVEVLPISADHHYTQPYECFHFQEIRDVLKEDDEVVIRGLSNEELRERRLGGRLQITSDGRHLIDGLSWGRRWRAGTGGVGRPEFVIPPRKRRRVMVEPEEEDDETARLELEYPPGRALVPFVDAGEEYIDLDDDDDEEDEDYEVKDGISEDSDSDEESVAIQQDAYAMSNSAKQVTTNAIFENVDSEDDDSGDEDSDEDLSEGAEDFAAELRAMTEDAGSASVNIGQPRATQRSQKVSKDIDNSQVDHTFEGFSSSQSRAQVNGSAEEDGTVMEDGHAVAHPVADNASKKQNAPSAGSVEDSIEEDADSSSDSEDSEASDAGSSSDDDSSTSDESSDSGDSTSSSDSSISSTKPNDKSAVSAETTRDCESHPGHDSNKAPEAVQRTTVPPGSGQNKTKRNNERKKLSKILSNLKEAGTLDKDADFKVLREYLAKTKTTTELLDEDARVDKDPAPSTQERVTARAQELLARLNQSGESIAETTRDKDTAHVALQNQDDPISEGKITLRPSSEQIVADVSVHDEPKVTSNSAAQTVPETSQMPAASAMESIEPSPKRARLDVAASRRMLFNSLGVRNPKTAEAEKALREKLAKPVRQVKSKEAVPIEVSRTKAPLAADRWKQKFTVMAVECIQERKKLDPPPFPFKQPWQIRQEKSGMARATRQQERYEAGLNYDEVEESQDTQPMDIEEDKNVEHSSQSLTTSRTLTAGIDGDDEDYPEPSDFTLLPALEKSNLLHGSMIAYKELQMNARFEPEHSAYRIAKIISCENGHITVKLAPKYRQPDTIQYDGLTGERLYNRFEVADDEEGDNEEPDDGVREVNFDQMIDPKIVATLQSPVQEQSKLNGDTISGASHLENAVKHLSHTLEHGTRVSTPRRAEISGMIKEAGFESGLGDNLMQGLVASARQDKTPTPTANSSKPTQDDTQTSARNSSSVLNSDDEGAFRESSVPSESMVESVRYPHLSELGPDTPMPAQSSSHQDAQQPISTPILPPADTTTLTATLPDPIQDADRQPDSLGSEVPQTQSQELIPDSQRMGLKNDKAYSLSVVNHGPKIEKSVSRTMRSHNNKKHTDAETNPTNDHGESSSIDGKSTDSNGFPTLRSLTASQTRRATTRGLKHKRTPSISPVAEEGEANHDHDHDFDLEFDSESQFHSQSQSQPNSTPLRRSPRTRKPTARSSDWSDTDEPMTSQAHPDSQSQSQSQSQPESASTSQHNNHTHFQFKSTSTSSSSQNQSQSRQEQNSRLSEIPEDTIFVDLTQSSPAASPGEGERKQGRGKGRGRSAVDVLKGELQGSGVGVGVGGKSHLKSRKRKGV